MSPMTAPPPDIPTQLADLSGVPLGEMPATAVAGEALQRVLPDRPVETVRAVFTSFI